jgi:radical SAM protein with 4Fe4S-binding SPASM domain
MAIITARVPNKLTVILTHRCNQRCEFCFDETSVTGKESKKAMSLETVEETIRFLLRSDVVPADYNITLSGGEPTLHPDFLSIVEMFSDAGFSLTILSNGQRFADRGFMEEVMKYNLWNFQFSVEGASPEVHDSRVKSRGAWNKVMRAIDNARDLGARYITNTTMTRLSVHQMADVIDMLDSMGVAKINIGNTLPECSGKNCGIIMEYPDVVEIAEQLNLYALTKRAAFSFITPLPLCLKEGRVISNPSVCSAGNYSIVMDYDGTFRPCSVCFPPKQDLPRLHHVNNLQAVHKMFGEIVPNYVSEALPQECRECKRLSDCKGACPLYWKMPWVRSPQHWEHTPLESETKNEGHRPITHC